MPPEMLRAVGLTSPLTVVPFDVVRAGTLSTPDEILCDASGRAVAWFRDRPFVAHPTLSDLLTLHGLALAARRAA
ncbi:MAG: hypothetical protein IPJ34_03945 [Myxococcales bacterium]|nr:hypothetical protein [Myxococcales bacterium]